MPVDFWAYESRLYPKIDATGMRGGSLVEAKFSLGEDYKVAVKIFTIDGTPLNLHREIGSVNIGFNANFWSGDMTLFRIDNRHGSLHFHAEDGSHAFSEHQQLPSQISISGCISHAFQKAEEIMREKYPDIEIKKGKEFVGFA